MYELVEEASKVLRTPPPKFDFDNPPFEPKELAEKLFELCEKYKGIGLSANQVNIPARVCVMMTKDGGKAYFNPELKAVSKETDLEKEGCLSFPDIFVSIKRSKYVEVEYQDENGEVQTDRLTGLAARCIQHEIDHLNGVIFLQRASRLKLERALKARPKVKQKRLQYEAKQAIIEKIQERIREEEQSKAAEEVGSDNAERSEQLDTLPQDSSTSSK